MRHIIVDGYNVIRADVRLQALERTSLEHAREVLVRMLASAPRLVNDRITVVFDGTHGSRRHIHSHRLGRIEMLYSAQGQTADEVIVTQARALRDAGRVVVVSNDIEVRDRCRDAGCEVSGAENLLLQVPGPAARKRPDDEDGREPTLSTVKRGNPRKTSKKARRNRDVRF